ncbi:endonuclease domain-containing protein [Lolliginicoccus lacisalsi]|uniref:endonuclease domain-containing protein n=1 Tax=Lolliginicoccus lacisalsi TaxID=2742202 RepID=UPI002FD0AD5C
MLRRDIPAADRTRSRGVAVVSRELAILETAITLPRGTAFLDRALQRHTLLPSLMQAHERNLPRRGGARSARMLAIAATGGASEAERMLVRVLRGSGITGWRLHVRAHGFEIDLAFERERVAIEVDGWAWHRDAERFARDLQRQNTLVNAGWHVLRFDWHRLAHDVAGVLGEIRAALARGRTPGLG